jgi:hypothetical protein
VAGLRYLPPSFDYAATLKRLRSPFLLDQMQPGTVLFFHLFRRMNSPAKVCKLRKFLLDGL